MDKKPCRERTGNPRQQQFQGERSPYQGLLKWQGFMTGLTEEELGLLTLTTWCCSERRRVKSMHSDVGLKNIDTGRNDSSEGTGMFAPALKAAGRYLPPLLTNQSCTTAVCPQTRGLLLSRGPPRTLLSQLALESGRRLPCDQLPVLLIAQTCSQVQTCL